MIKKATSLIKEAQDQMIKAHKEEHLVDIVWLMSEVTGKSRMDLVADGDYRLTDLEIATFKAYTCRRLAGEPLQYILGNQSFYGYEFKVSPSVLIPRFETELLAHEVIQHIERTKACSFIDMCTGSGCIGISLAKECPDIKGYLVDLSDKALSVASENCHNLKVEDRLKVIKSDLFQNLEGLKVDVVVSNPPYITSSVIPTLAEEVQCSEPNMALDGGEDGLVFYRRLAKEAKNHLTNNGLLMVEIGWDQMKAVQEIMQEEGYKDISGLQDLAGKDRMVKGSWMNV